jgi:hypothetical protein
MPIWVTGLHAHKLSMDDTPYLTPVPPEILYP